MKNKKLNIKISGADTNIANISQGDGNILNANIESDSSKNKQECQQAILTLKNAIKLDVILSQVESQSAISDLTNFNKEINKPEKEQNKDTKKFLWGRLTEILKISSTLISLSVTVAKLTGIV